MTEGEEIISPDAILLHLNWRQWHIGLHAAALIAFVVSLIIAFAQYSKVVGHSSSSPIQPGTSVDAHRAIGYAVIVLVVFQVGASQAVEGQAVPACVQCITANCI
jgi:choline-glycine betaine transporter